MGADAMDAPNSANPDDRDGPPRAVPPAAPPSGLAIFSLVVSIAGFCVPVIGGGVGLVLGIAGLRSIRRSNGRLSGRNFATAGIAISATSIVFYVAVLLVTVLYVFPSLSATDSAFNIRTISYATERYTRQHQQQFPSPQSWDKVLLDARLLAANDFDNPLTDPYDPPGMRSYAMNSALDGLKRTDVPGNTVIFFECAPGSPPGGGKELLPAKPRHAGKYQVGFVDGRVQPVAPEDIDSLIWNPQDAAPPK